MKKEGKVRKVRKLQDLQKGYTPAAIRTGIEAGEKMTIHEWAEYMRTSYEHIMVSLCALRKKGYHYHPHKGKILVKGKQRIGILVDIMKNEEYLQMGVNTYEDHQSLPALRGIFRIIESGIERQPQMALEMQSYVDGLQELMISARKRIYTRKPLELTSKK